MFVYPVTRPFSRPVLVPQANRVRDGSFERFFGNAAVAESVRSPALEVSETDAAYIVSFDVPGVSREQLKVSIQGRRVAVESVAIAPAPEVAAEVAVEGAAPKAEAAPAAPRTLYRERSRAPFARTLSLPAEVDQTASQAKVENGVLTLTLTKKVPTGATQLTIG